MRRYYRRTRATWEIKKDMLKKMREFFHGPAWQNGMKRAAFVLEAVCYGVCGIIAVYMFIHRFLHLHNGLQYDELYSTITASPALPFSFIWQDMLLKDINLPLFNVLLFGWNRVFPDTVVSMHLFSALCGAGAVVAAWFLAPKQWPALKKWIFLTLMSGSFVLVCYGAIIRTYSLSVLLSTVFTLLALELIRLFSMHEAPSAGRWLAFLGVGLLGAYSHYFCAGVFFSTALVVFLYACYYKIGRAWAFWGTAVVFALWSVWVVNAVGILRASDGGWWYTVPTPKAIWEMLTFLFGPRNTFIGILYGAVIAMVSLVSTYRKSLFKQADIMLPLAQILLLCAVVAVVSCKYNLWMDRYFLPVMPCVLLLMAGFLYHLYQRHAVLLILWPVLLWAWVQYFWVQDYLYYPEFTGLRGAFTFLVDELKVDKILVDTGRVEYPEAAWPYMMKHYIPEGKKVELIGLTPQTAPLGWQTTPKIPVVTPVCSQLHLIYSSLKMNMEEDAGLMLFGNDVCVYTIHPLARKENV